MPEFEPIPDVNLASFRLGRASASILANIQRYFFLPCYLCGIMWAGYEWKNVKGRCNSIPVNKSETRSWGICPWCTEAGRGCLVTARELGHGCPHGVRFEPECP
jgi:hypothetical protein